MALQIRQSLRVILGFAASFYFLSKILNEISIPITATIWPAVGITLVVEDAIDVFYKQSIWAKTILNLII